MSGEQLVVGDTKIQLYQWMVDRGKHRLEMLQDTPEVLQGEGMLPAQFVQDEDLNDIVERQRFAR